MQTSQLRTALLLAALAGAALLPSTLFAQAVTGVGDDATMPKRGELRFSVLSVWNAWSERYGQGTAGRPNGSVEPLGVNFNLDTIGIAQIENLSAEQSAIRTLSGLPNFTSSLGTSRVQLHDNILSTPLSLELGLTNRISVSVMVPFVTATSNVDFTMNPTGHEATLGFNPTLIAPAASAVLASDAAFFAQFDSASSQLFRAITACNAAPSTAGCAPINANPAAARALITDANNFTVRLAAVYGGRGGTTGNVFVPIAGTAAQTAIEAKIAAYKAMYAAYGTTGITSTGPVAAQAPLTATDMQNVFTNAAYGISAKPLATTIMRGLGDVEFGLKVNVLDPFHGSDSARFSPKGFNWRQSFGGIYRLGTGTLPSPADFTAIGTGDHQSSIQVKSFTDLLYGPHFWVSVVASYTSQMADQLAMRIPDSPSQVILASYRQETVNRRLGNTVDIQVTPRWNFNDYISLAGQYYYRHKAADVYSGTFDVFDLNQNKLTLDASVLGMFTEASESRFGVGATYSTVGYVTRHKS
ncbi:MAG TPA: hypothetical protein VGQ30_04475, partial [Gemmatimonadaceae bacterium]|nr:hypothetical protein [Gemmatimonadaceae bacterium]